MTDTVTTDTVTGMPAGGRAAQPVGSDAMQTSPTQGNSSVDLSTIKNSAIERLVAERGKLTDSLRTFTDELRSMENAAPESGLATSLVGQAADRAEQLISYVEDREPDQLLAEARSYARTHPGMFLLGAVVAGGVLGRATRSAGAAAAVGAQSPAEAPAAVDLR